MPIFKRWSDEEPPSDDGVVVVVLHRGNRATVIVSPPSAGGLATPSDAELDTPEALQEAKFQAISHGIKTVYVSVNESAPWNKEWGTLTE